MSSERQDTGALCLNNGCSYFHGPCQFWQTVLARVTECDPKTCFFFRFYSAFLVFLFSHLSQIPRTKHAPTASFPKAERADMEISFTVPMLSSCTILKLEWMQFPPAEMQKSKSLGSIIGGARAFSTLTAKEDLIQSRRGPDQWNPHCMRLAHSKGPRGKKIRQNVEAIRSCVLCKKDQCKSDCQEQRGELEEQGLRIHFRVRSFDQAPTKFLQTPK